jgi:hypothetical protein
LNWFKALYNLATEMHISTEDLESAMVDAKKDNFPE